MHMHLRTTNTSSSLCTACICVRCVRIAMCVADKSGDTVAMPPELKVSGKSYDADVLAPEDEWIAKLDHEAFKEDIRSLGKELAANQGPEDVAHLKKIIGWSRACSMIGMLTMAYCINPISIYLISIGTMTRWAIIGHHICHCLLYTSPSPRDRTRSRMPSSA